MALPVSVHVALTSAEELSVWLEQADLDDAEQRVWLAWQAQMLAHWAETLANESSGYVALATGLAEFAARVEHQLRLTEP